MTHKNMSHYWNNSYNLQKLVVISHSCTVRLNPDFLHAAISGKSWWMSTEPWILDAHTFCSGSWFLETGPQWTPGHWPRSGTIWGCCGCHRGNTAICRILSTTARWVDVWFAACICHGDSSRVVNASVSEARVVVSGSILTHWIAAMWHCWVSTMSPWEYDIIQGHYEEKKIEDNGHNLP